MSFADSILQTASIARWVSVAVTAADQTMSSSELQASSFRPDRYFLLRPDFVCISENPAAAFWTSGGKSDIS
jgi:hypothetical protein